MPPYGSYLSHPFARSVYGFGGSTLKYLRNRSVKVRRNTYRRRARRYPHVPRQYRPGGIQGQEMKVITWAQSSFNPIAAGTSVILMNKDIGTGTGPNDRIGSITTIKAIDIHLCVKNEAADLPQCYLMKLLWDKQANGVLATPEQIFEGTAPYTSNAFPEMDSRDRFKTLMTKKFSMGSLNGTGGSDNSAKYFNFHCGANLQTTYINSATGAIADIVTGALIIVFVADETTNTAKFNLEWRLRFIDSKGDGSMRIFKRNIQTDMV